MEEKKVELLEEGETGEKAVSGEALHCRSSVGELES